MKNQFLFLFLVFVGNSMSIDPSGCKNYITMEDDSVWDANLYITDKILDDDEVLNKQFPLTGVGPVVIDNKAGTGVDYIDVVIEDNNLIFRTNDNFANFDANTPKQTSKTITITVTVQLQCALTTATTSLSFAQTIQDVNNHAPTFQQEVYSYNMPMPLVPRIDLTSLGQQIIATDLDFSNQNVVFTVDSMSDEYWELETSSSTDSKDYRAILKVSQFARIAGQRSLTLTATDSGTPPLTSTATINITIDESFNLVEEPKFSAPMYEFKYTTDENGIPSVQSESKITVTSTNNEEVLVSLDENDYFEAKYYADSQEVVLGVKSSITELTAESLVVLTLTVSLSSSTDVMGKSVIIITVPSLSDVPTFSQSSYWFDYSMDDNLPVLSPEEAIIVFSIYPDDTQVVIDNSVSSYFNIRYHQDTKVVDLEVIAPIDTTSISVVEFALLVYLKSYPDYWRECTILIRLPSESVNMPPSFSRAYYTGTYTSSTNGPDTVQLQEEISVSQNASVTLESDQGLGDYFALTFIDDKSWQLVLTKNLDATTLSKGREIVLILKASVAGADDGTAVIVIDLPKVSETPSLEFDRLYYSAIYTVIGGSPTLIYDSNGLITTPGASDTVEVTFVENSGSVFFNITRSGDNWNVVPVQELPQVIINDKQNYILTLQEEDPKNSDAAAAFATFIIELPKCTSKLSLSDANLELKFSKSFYSASYVEDSGTATVLLAVPIEISSSYNVEFAFIGDFANNFEFSYQQSAQISVKKNLDAGIVRENREIFLTLQATGEKSVQTVTTLIVLEFH